MLSKRWKRMKRALLVLLLSPMIISPYVTVSHSQHPVTSQYTITQITDNDYRDMWPSINNNGDLVWMRLLDSSIGVETFEIVLYDGTT